VDWTHGAEHMKDAHGIEVSWANEALEDPDALQINPDPSSISGQSVRTVGYSTSAGSVLTVITVAEGETVYGANGWRSNQTDIKRYRGEKR
jgi:hypothetical protein